MSINQGLEGLHLEADKSWLWGLPVRCNVLSSIPGVYPLRTISAHTCTCTRTQSVVTSKSPDIAICTRGVGQNGPQLRTCVDEGRGLRTEPWGTPMFRQKRNQ